MSLLMMGESAVAWPDPLPGRYRIIDLWEIGFAPNPDIHGKMGINNKGQVVYTAKVGSDFHAHIYLPEADPLFNNLEPGVHDLHGLGEFSESFDSIARDINETGMIVGQYGAIADGDGVGIFWVFAVEEEVIPGTIGTLGSGTWSSAHAVNDDDPPVVVGNANVLVEIEECPCDASGEGETTLSYNRGFYCSPTVDNTPIQLPTTGGTESFGRDVMITLDTEDPPNIGGYTDCGFYEPSLLECLAANMPCDDAFDPVFDAVIWIEAVADELPDLHTNTVSRAYGINDTGEMVGHGHQIPDINCIQHAMYWDETTADEELPDVVGSNPSATAFAINNATLRQVVGRYSQDSIGVLWEQTGDSPPWEVTNLDALYYPGNRDTSCDVKWQIFQAHDINDNGEIAVDGRRYLNPGFEYRAFLLVPFESEFNPCPADANFDDNIDIEDLLMVIENWGACTPFVDCLGDADCSGVIDSEDLHAILIKWEAGCREIAGEDAPKTVWDCWELYDNEEIDLAGLEACLEAIETLP